MSSTIRKALYLAGPMTGIEDFNYPAFHAAAKALRARGYAVINPAEAFGGDQALSFDTYMRYDLICLLKDCDGIVVLDGWEKSPGAVLEVSVASALGYGILKLVEGQDAYADGYALESLFPVHETNHERLGHALASYVYPIPAVELTSKHAEQIAAEVLKPLKPWLKPAPVKAPGPEPLTTWQEAEDGLLKAADGIVNGDRQRTYGHPITHHTATAAMWQAYLTRVNGEHEVIVRPQDVSILMVLDKVSRVGGGDKVDNLLDIAGYAQVHAKVRAAQQADNGGVFE